jgi:hypothetical protein
MKTDDLIAALAADHASTEPPVGRSLARDALFGFVASAIFFFLVLGLRKNFFASLDQPRFLFTFLLTGTMAATGLYLAWRLARPVSAPGLAARALWIAPALLALACGVEFFTAPRAEWAAR